MLPAKPATIYQPRTLTLKAGQPVITPNGIYTPQVDETWHSAAAFRAVEQQAVDCAAAYAEIYNRTK